MKTNEQYRSHEDCYYRLENSVLSIGNYCFERSWSLAEGFPVVVSLYNARSKREWLSIPDVSQDEFWPAFPHRKAFAKTELIPSDRPSYDISSSVHNDLGRAKECFQIEVRFTTATIELTWVHLLYPGEAIHRSYIDCRLIGRSENVVQETTEYQGSELSLDNAEASDIVYAEDYIDFLPLAEKHCFWELVRFNDRTDVHNDLVHRQNGLFFPTTVQPLQGNLLFIHDRQRSEGLTLVKEGPTPLAYQGSMTHDFELNGSQIRSVGWGFTADELNTGERLRTYGATVIFWEPGEIDGLTALHRYHDCVQTYEANRDANVMSNTWGDRSRDGRVNEAFILEELEAAHRLGVNLLQIDDGWQTGTTINSIRSGGIWEGYHNENASFWSVNRDRFPQGLGSIAAKSAAFGIKLGLWFSPDSTADFRNWEKDADILLDLHRQYNVVAFKLDGIKIRSKRGEENLYLLQEKVVRESHGQVFFNLDTTAETRDGFFGRVNYGNLFLENRYTDWQKYYPHWTLRNLWQLAKYYPTRRLQIEFLNVNRNTAIYGDDPLAPARCGLEYSFAVTMFATPLAWMELSGLDEASLRLLEPLIKAYQSYQAEILAGCIWPIGAEPSGFGWSGFHSVVDDSNGFLLIMKERSEHDRYQYHLRGLANRSIELEHLLGRGESRIVAIDHTGNLDFSMPAHFQFSLYHYKVVD